MTDRSPEPTAAAAIDRLLEEERTTLVRVTAEELDGEMTAGALVVDTRPVEQRQRDGSLPGALVVDRNVLEWRLDPTSPHRLPEATDPGRRIIIVCNEGYSSTLAAATLRRIGLPAATDLVGGFQAWLRLREAQPSVTPSSVTPQSVTPPSVNRRLGRLEAQRLTALEALPLGNHGVLRVLRRLLASLEDPEPGARRAGEERRT
jgi:rhodanese-related sulfurtransferase